MARSSGGTLPFMAPQNGYAGLFVDFENVYYYFKNRLPPDMDAADACISVLRSLQKRVRDERAEKCIVQHAYADFERVQDGALNSLFLMGIEPHHVVGTEQKNAADMKLCIDAMTTLYTRPDVTTFYLMAGDRDYIPVIRHLEEHGREVMVVAFRKQTSGDLLKIVGEGYWDATDLIEPSTRTVMVEPITQTPMPKKKAGAQAAVKTTTVASPPLPLPEYPASEFSDPHTIDDQYVYNALIILMENFQDKPEVWVSPYLHRLRDGLPELEDWERKHLINDLVDSGAVKVEKRRGEPNDYSVLLVNWNHPDVRELVKQ